MLLICVALVFLLPAFIRGLGCGNRPAGSRVINGQDASPHSWPWQISLRVRDGHICGGTLIRPDWVLTAAHCVDKNPDPNRYTVVVGAHLRRGTTSVQETFKLKQVIKHSGFNKKLENDIALLQLTRPVTLSDKVNLACLPTAEATVGAKCYITGWGRMENGVSANVLQQAILPVVSYETCRNIWRIRRGPHLCAGEGRDGASGGCNGDSGGPLVCEEGGRWVVHGAVSFGMRYCPTTHYTVFARVSSYLDWINSNIAGIPLPPSPPSPPPPTPGPSSPPLITPPPGGCSDLWGPSLCKFYKSRCSSQSFVQKACRKTCNLCGQVHSRR